MDSWQQSQPAEIPKYNRSIRGQRHLVGSVHPAFPDEVPFANDSVYQASPTSACADGVAAGELAGQIISEIFDDRPAIRFTGFGLNTREDFRDFAHNLGFDMHCYKGGAALRDRNESKINVASVEPSEIFLTPHNEMAYMPGPPSKILFFCLRPANSGGEVPINDIRKVTANLPIAIKDELRERKISYIRRCTRENTAFSVGWAQSFGTDDKSEVESYLKSTGVNFEWESGDYLRTWYVHSAFDTYQGEEVWFNQLTESHSSYWLDSPVYQALGVTRANIHADTTFGDGAPFPDDLVSEIRGTIWQSVELVKLDAGEAIILDNLVIQHGRMAYVGERQHLVSVFV